MEYEDVSTRCFVATCVIDGKTAAGNSVFGALLAVVDAGVLALLKIRFAGVQFDKDAPWTDLLQAIDAPKPEDYPENFKKFEGQLSDFIVSSGIFQNSKKLSDLRAAEREISYFCSSDLEINAIAFLDLTDENRSSLDKMIPELAGAHAVTANGAGGEDSGGGALPGLPEAGGAGSSPRGGDIFVPCDPVLDPVSGVAAGELKNGWSVCCRLPGDSVFYKLMAKTSPGFDGVVSGEVVGVRVGEDGPAVVALKLSEGVSGALRLPPRVRVKMVPGADAVSSRPLKSVDSERVQILLAASGLIALLCVMWILLRDLS
jgi:hypothetical protein